MQCDDSDDGLYGSSDLSQLISELENQEYPLLTQMSPQLILGNSSSDLISIEDISDIDAP